MDRIKRGRARPDTSGMDACPSCGARITAEATWCGQCFATIDRSVPHGPGRRGPPPKQEFHQATYSRWRGGETSFGPIGRIVMTVGALLGLVIGYPLTRGLIFATVGMDVPGTGFVLMYAGIAAVAGIWLLGRIWRRTRVS
jgi:predicted MFS family arabinose efflux permease